MPTQSPPPLFICGNARGGTTLLVRLLDGHPDLLVLPTETQIYPNLATRPAARWLLRASEFIPYRRAVEALATPWIARAGFRDHAALLERIRAWAGEYPEFLTLPAGELEAAAEAVAGPEEYWQPFLALFRRAAGAELDAKRYWVEKTPGAERFAAVSDRWFGRSGSFLQVVRDPRDFVASNLVRRQRLGVDISRARSLAWLCFTWSQSISWCDHHIRTIPGRYHALRYEDLVADVEGTMSEVCRRIGIPMRDELLTATRMGMGVGLNSSYSDVGASPGEVVSSRIGAFAEALSEEEVATIEGLLHAQMIACGYRLSREAPAARGSGIRRREEDWRSRLYSHVVARQQAKWKGRTLPRIGMATHRPNSRIGGSDSHLAGPREGQ